MADAKEATESEELRLLRRFGPSDPVAEPGRVTRRDDAWLVSYERPGFFARLLGQDISVVRLFDADAPDNHPVKLVLRASVKVDGAFHVVKLMLAAGEGREAIGSWQRDTRTGSDGDWDRHEAVLPLSGVTALNQVELFLFALGSGTVLVRDMELFACS